MKRDALSHPKMLDLSSRLNIPRSQAIGILTLLFDFTAQFAPQGDIGKHRNGAIARACDWMGSADEFIESLIETGWIDPSEHHRLMVHDWHEHCEQWVRLKLQKLKLDFLTEYRGQLPQGSVRTVEGDTVMPIAGASVEPVADGSASRDQAKPSQAQAKPEPSLVKPSQAKGGVSASAVASPPLPTQGDLLVAWNTTMDQSCEITDKRAKAIAQRLKDPKWVARWREALVRCSDSYFCRGVNARGWVADFEWFIKPESVTKILEGKYDNRQGVSSPTFDQLKLVNSKKAIEDFANGGS